MSRFFLFSLLFHSFVGGFFMTYGLSFLPSGGFAKDGFISLQLDEVLASNNFPALASASLNTSSFVSGEGNTTGVSQPVLSSVQEGEGRKDSGAVEASFSSSFQGDGFQTPLTSSLHRHIHQYLKYPSRAREEGLTGQLTLSLSVAKDGTILSVETLSSSGYSLLDESAKRSVYRASPLPKRFSSNVTVQVPVVYSLQ